MTDTNTSPEIGPRIGLALGSVVGRGWAHIGVLRGLEKAGIEVDLVAGTSIGALVAGVHLAGHLDALEDLFPGRGRLSAGATGIGRGCSI